MNENKCRLPSLDGLRGVAALVVVVFHVVICSPREGAVYASDGRMPTSVLESVADYSPLRVFWAGSEAVVVFFVLSGLVLSLPFVSGRQAPWASFYAQRLARLYVPAIASLVLAWMTTIVVPRVVSDGASPWLAVHATESTGLREVVKGSSLLAGWGGLNSSLWSLRWEVMFSIFLPLFVLVGIRLASGAWAKAVLAALAVAFAALWPLYGFFYPDLVYVSCFAVGVLMASRMASLERVAERVRPWGWFAIVAIAGTLLVNSWIVAGLDPESRLRNTWVAAATVAAALLVFTVAFCPGVRSVFRRGPIHWLGTISFSLYLVQEPVVVGLAFLTGARAPLAVQLVVGVAVSIALAWVFHRLVEKPSHHLAKALGRRARRIGADGPVTVAA